MPTSKTNLNLFLIKHSVPRIDLSFRLYFDVTYDIEITLLIRNFIIHFP
jgi:hypothetical protein